MRYIMRPALGHSLTVELRTLTPSVLVRIQLPQPPFASVTMRWQARAEQFTRRSATRSFNEVWQTHLILNIIKIPACRGFYIYVYKFIATILVCF